VSLHIGGGACPSAAEPFLFANAESFTIPAGILTTTAVQATSYIFTLEVTREPAPPAADTETLRTKTVGPARYWE